MATDKIIYVFHAVLVNGRDINPSIYVISPQESVAHQEGCKKMLQDLRERFGDPKPLNNDDELINDDVFNNQQMMAAFDCYKNKDIWTDGPNKGKLKLGWVDRYRRIDAIYEKLRSDKPNTPQTYYYMTKQKITILK
jgi:hypothetical protein